MTRRNLRIQIFKLLFRVEFNQPEEMSEQMALFFNTEETIDEEAQAEIQEKYEAIEGKLSELDRMLNEKATGWTTTRLSLIHI